MTRTIDMELLTTAIFHPPAGIRRVILRAIAATALLTTTGIAQTELPGLTPSVAVPANQPSITSALQIPYSDGKAPVVVYANQNPLLACTAGTSHLVIAIHGQTRSAETTLAAVVKSASGAGLLEETMIIAPFFGTPEQLAALGDSPNKLQSFTGGAWRFGGNASTPNPVALRDSSFEIVERLAELAKVNCPSISRLTVIGHSAGGQFVNRFAAYTDMPRELFPSGIHFIITNPSSYLYFGRERPIKKSRTLSFSTKLAFSCPQVNSYQYGLSKLPARIAAIGPAALGWNYSAREVSYLAGELDTNPNNSSLDKSCAANAQGRHRLERAKNYYAYLGKRFGPTVYQRHRFVLVRGVGHDTGGMYSSPEGIATIFGNRLQ